MVINVPAGIFPLILSPETFLTQGSNVYLQCQTAGGALPVINIGLPRITTIGGVTTTWGFKIYINDVDNNASVKNIILTPHPADKINGVLGTPIVLNTNGVTGHLQVVGINAWEFSLGSSSSGGGGDTFEDGTFILNADGSAGSGTVNGDATKVSYNAGTKVMTFTTAKKLKLGFITGLAENGSVPVSSFGKDNGIKADCKWSNDSDRTIGGSPADLFNSIHLVNNVRDGWTGLITAINPTSFDITFTQAFSGLDITGQFHLIVQ